MQVRSLDAVANVRPSLANAMQLITLFGYLDAFEGFVITYPFSAL